MTTRDLKLLASVGHTCNDVMPWPVYSSNISPIFSTEVRRTPAIIRGRVEENPTKTDSIFDVVLKRHFGAFMAARYTQIHEILEFAH